MRERINAVVHKLSEQNLDALFVSNPANVRYFTGFDSISNEREGFFFITAKNAYLIAFSTVFGLFKGKNTDFIPLCITHDMRLKHHIEDIIRRENVRSMAFEGTDLTVSELDSLRSGITASCVKTEGLIEGLRSIKSEEEIKQIRNAADLTDKCFAFAKEKITANISERHLALEIEYYLRKNGAELAFSPIVAFNEHSAIPHFSPSNTALDPHSIILLDFGAKINGYCADMTRVVFFGQPKTRWLTMYETVLDAQKRAINEVRPGKSGQEIDRIARDRIIESKFPEYPHGLGHGVGLAIHENPRLRKDSTDILGENMIVTIEPGIYLEGDCGVRIEDLLLLRKDGAELLSKSPKEITIL